METFSWENIWKATVVLFIIFLFALTSMYTFSTKEFKGYYLNKNERTYTVSINWENAPDETAFSSTNPDETLRVYKILTDNTTKR